MKKLVSGLFAVMTATSVYPLEPNEFISSDPAFSLGARSSFQWSDQSPIEDLTGYGIIGRFHLGKNRELGIGIDVLSDDFDDPAGELGLQVSADSKHSSAKIMADLISVWGQQNFDLGSDRYEPFVLVGLALASIDMESHKGSLEDGTQYDLRTNAGTEHIFMAGGGIQSKLFRSVELELAFRGEYHLANWTIEDRVSGAYIAADDYPALAGYIALGTEF
jgi:hypothetical protein